MLESVRSILCLGGFCRQHIPVRQAELPGHDFQRLGVGDGNVARGELLAHGLRHRLRVKVVTHDFRFSNPAKCHISARIAEVFAGWVCRLDLQIEAFAMPHPWRGLRAAPGPVQP
jgi:hypothetical protein